MGNSYDSPITDTFDESKFKSIGITNKNINGSFVLKCNDVMNMKYMALARITVPRGAIVVKHGTLFRTNVYKIDKIIPSNDSTYHVFDKCVNDYDIDTLLYEEGCMYVKNMNKDAQANLSQGLPFCRDQN